MQPHDPNAPYIPPPSPPLTPSGSPPRPVEIIDQSTARALAAAAHGAIAFGLFGIGFIVSLAIAGVIWLYGRRSPLVRFHSEQAGCYQVLVLLINIVLVIALGASGGFSIFRLFSGESDLGLGGLTLVGLALFVLWFLGTIFYGIFAAVMVLLGRPFKYPVIGDRFRG
jgi:uncharacterized Tic20 family protein